MPPLTLERVPLALTTLGATVSGAACLQQITKKTAKTGTVFADVRLGHAEGSATVRVWSDALPRWEAIGEGTALHVTLKTKAGWRAGTLEWEVLAVETLPSDHPIRDDLLPACPVAAVEITARWQALVAQLTPGARTFLDVVLEHVGPAVYDRMAAAERMHHACVGGLKWHSIEVGELALQHARAIPQYTPLLSVDCLIVGAVLHDLGKVSEMSVDRGVGIRRAPQGWARYHTTLGSQLIAVACALHADRLREAGTSPVLIDHTLHVVESHHATKEFGSPTPPRSLEAWLIHCADLASARLRELTDALEGRPVDASGWCGLQDGGKTPVYAPGLGVSTPVEDDAGALPPSPQPPARTLDLIVLRPAPPVITTTQEHA